MIVLHKSTKYQRALRKFVKANPKRVEKTYKALKRFIDNPKHPSLNTEKLHGTELCTIRIDRANRIYFVWIDKKTALLIDIGEHDKYRLY